MKKLLALILTVVFACSLFAGALAESWVCPDCGETNEGNFCEGCGAAKPAAGGSDEWTCPNCGETSSKNFCANCGTPKPGGSAPAAAPASGSISNISFQERKNGETVISWDSTSDGPFNVFFSLPEWVDYSTDFGIGSVRNKTATTNSLVPGQTYTVTVTDGSARATTQYSVPYYSFTDFASNRVLMCSVSNFNLSGNGYFETFKVELQHPRLRNERVYGLKLVLKTPLGYSSFIRQTTAFTMVAGGRARWWEKWNISELMDEVKRDYGYIPSGRYTIQAYMDNALYAEVSFSASAP